MLSAVITYQTFPEIREEMMKMRKLYLRVVYFLRERRSYIYNHDFM